MCSSRVRLPSPCLPIEVLIAGLKTLRELPALNWRDFTDRSEHFTNPYRFLARAEWDVDALSEKLFLMLVHTLVHEQAGVVIVVDDTLLYLYLVNTPAPARGGLLP